jgi:hypothetical protein
MVGFTSVDTKGSVEGVGVEVAISSAADFAGAGIGIAIATKHSSTIEILILFNNMVPPDSYYQYSNAGGTQIKIGQRLPALSDLRNQM